MEKSEENKKKTNYIWYELVASETQKADRLFSMGVLAELRIFGWKEGMECSFPPKVREFEEVLNCMVGLSHCIIGRWLSPNDNCDNVLGLGEA